MLLLIVKYTRLEWPPTAWRSHQVLWKVVSRFKSLKEEPQTASWSHKPSFYSRVEIRLKWWKLKKKDQTKNMIHLICTDIYTLLACVSPWTTLNTGEVSDRPEPGNCKHFPFVATDALCTANIESWEACVFSTSSMQFVQGFLHRTKCLRYFTRQQNLTYIAEIRVHFQDISCRLTVVNVTRIVSRFLSQLFCQSLFRGCSTFIYHKPEERFRSPKNDSSMTLTESMKV
jgi:hypothetical protein